MTEPSEARRKADEINLKLAQSKALAAGGCGLIMLPFLVLMLVGAAFLLFVVVSAAFHH